MLVVKQQKRTLAGKLEITPSRVLNYHGGTGSGAQSYRHTRNQGLYQAADASCLSIAAIVAALAEC